MTEQSTAGRLLSLDVFRGATIAAMILVNNPGTWGDAYPQLRHAAWNGWTMTDMIFPFFLWIVGVAMTFSFAKRREEGADRRRLFVHSLRRSVIIFALGILVSGFPFGLFHQPFSFATLRIPGVLQRIAVCYLIASAIFLTTGVRAQLTWSVGLLIAYWLLVKLVPVPGYGAGLLEPTGNLAWYIDSTLLAGHTWIYAPAPGFDPEGILSTLPAISTTLFGILTGHWMRSTNSPEEKTGRMFVVGYAMLLIGVVADIWLPINKNLWTSSYAVFMGGWALVGLGLCYWLVDVKRYRAWTKPVVIFGMNAITVYVVSELLATLLWIIPGGSRDGVERTLHDVVMQEFFSHIGPPPVASLLFAIAFVLVMYLLAWLMWRRRVFIKV